MRIRRFNPAVPALLLPVLLAACAEAPRAAGSPEPPPTAVSPRCNAAPAQFAVGRTADAALAEEARIRSGARTVRVLRPNEVVTMEFNAERLNLAVDQAGRVIRVNCG
ncbi:starvation-inducible protein [Polaromonas sp. P1(28)-8]|nr:starvation-inducible protein [Polaromonas sp. P1(28)-8]